MSNDVIGKCWNCSSQLSAADYGRENNCLKCGKPSRVCRNCRWYDPGVTDQCGEPTADPVMDKVRANYCDFFEPTLQPVGASDSSADDLRQAAEDLFKF
jgi:hypothetical protein